MEWIQNTFTSLGTWGSATYTQLYNLPLLQLVSITGIAGPSFLIYWCQILLTYTIHDVLDLIKSKQEVSSIDDICSVWTSWIIWTIIMIVIHFWGTIRLDRCNDEDGTVTVAAIGTDATFGGLPLPSSKEIDTINQQLWIRTEHAAIAGAKLISWTEGATLILPDKEPYFLQHAQECTKNLKVEMILSYIVPVQTKPLMYENKAVWIRPDGTIDHVYLKNEPVPGEPAIRGEKGKVKVVETSFGVRAALAICYDYDFPYLARNHALQHIGLVVVPSSDWKGIDPTHTQMASVRAIENGSSVLRSTRFGLSAGIDCTGRMLGQLSANKSKEEKILMVSLPIRQNNPQTFYGRFGDLLVYLSIVFVLGLNAYSFVGVS
jgi:apolipoprotein N-acyltransferase